MDEPQTRTEAETPEQREIRQHIEALRDHGYIVGVACHNCGATLTARRSIARSVGPVCRKRRTQ